MDAVPSETPCTDAAQGRALPLLRAYFGALKGQPAHGATAELIEMLASGTLTDSSFRELVQRHRLSHEPWFRKQCLDLVLGFLQTLLDSGPLTSEAQEELFWLKRSLAVREGELFDYRPAEITALLGGQMEAILADGAVDDAEERYQVELQRALDLGYDQYLALSRRAIEDTLRDLELRLAMRESASEDLSLRERIRALQSLYWLATGAADIARAAP